MIAIRRRGCSGFLNMAHTDLIMTLFRKIKATIFALAPAIPSIFLGSEPIGFVPTTRDADRATIAIEITITSLPIVKDGAARFFLIPWERASTAERAARRAVVQEAKGPHRKDAGYGYSIAVEVLPEGIQVHLDCMLEGEGQQIAREAAFVVPIMRDVADEKASIDYKVLWKELNFSKSEPQKSVKADEVRRGKD